MRMHMHISLTVYMCKRNHIFCIWICQHTDICLKHIYTCNICISMSAGMLLVMFYFSWSCSSLKKSSFPQKEMLILCYPSVGWQRWALIKKNYSRSCSCYPLCEIINDFIDSWHWRVLYSFWLKWNSDSFKIFLMRCWDLPVCEHVCVWWSTMTIGGPLMVLTVLSSGRMTTTFNWCG